MAVEGRGRENVMVKEREVLKVYQRKRKGGGSKIGEEMKGVEKVNMSKGLATAEEPATLRPMRERKVVERFSVPDSEAMVSKGLVIKKGRGIKLKDITNVANNLSKRKADGNLQMLHTILFGKKSNKYHIKRNISQFSGFVWGTNEEKEREKIEEKIEKCVKEMLFDFCQLLDVPVTKAATKVELSAKLFEFLECPHATTEIALDEKDQVKGSSPKKEKLAPIKKNSTSSKSVTGKGNNVTAPSTSDSKGKGPSSEKHVQKKSKACHSANAEPNQQEMLTIVTDMLRTIDFEHATLNDILKELEDRYSTDLSHRKAEVGSLIEVAINNMTAQVRNIIEEAADDVTDNEEEEGEDDEMNFWN